MGIKNVKELKKSKEKKALIGEFNPGKTLYIIISLVLTVILFIGLLFIKEKIASDVKYVNVATVIKDVSQGEIITSKNVEDYFKIEKVPSDQNIKGTYEKLKDIKDVKTKVDLKEGEVVAEKDFVDTNKYVDDIKNPVLTSIAVSSVSNAVGGSLREGDIINISVITNQSTSGSSVGTVGADKKTYNFNTVYVDNAKDNNGADIAIDDKESSATVFSVILNKEDSDNLNAALNNGSLVRIEKVLNE